MGEKNSFLLVASDSTAAHRNMFYFFHQNVVNCCCRLGIVKTRAKQLTIDILFPLLQCSVSMLTVYMRILLLAVWRFRRMDWTELHFSEANSKSFNEYDHSLPSYCITYHYMDFPTVCRTNYEWVAIWIIKTDAFWKAISTNSIKLEEMFLWCKTLRKVAIPSIGQWDLFQPQLVAHNWWRFAMSVEKWALTNSVPCSQLMSILWN